MISIADVQRAKVDIAPYVKRTILEKNTTLSDQLATNVYLKLELFQRTGSFKPRGAFSQILQLTPEQRQHGVVGVSGGNFAQGMALAARALSTRAIVCMPASTPRNYIEATQGFGAEVDLSPDFPQVFARADQLKREGWNLFHPFDNPFQMAGAGTIGLEILAGRVGKAHERRIVNSPANRSMQDTAMRRAKKEKSPTPRDHFSTPGRA